MYSILQVILQYIILHYKNIYMKTVFDATTGILFLILSNFSYFLPSMTTVFLINTTMKC